MRTKISAPGFDRKDVQREVSRQRRHMLGRLQWRVARAQLSLAKEDQSADDDMHVCSLRLKLRDDSDVMILARAASSSGAISKVFRRTRYELLRRRYQPRKLRAWSGLPQPA